jgi:hypothetical protein
VMLGFCSVRLGTTNAKKAALRSFLRRSRQTERGPEGAQFGLQLSCLFSERFKLGLSPKSVSERG